MVKNDSFVPMFIAIAKYLSQEKALVLFVTLGILLVLAVAFTPKASALLPLLF